ncbi:unnamed protein product [Rotaria socialis]|nr:unnamed protein product [Rotaria socialis]CAF3413134.1 unnamed protein product [Rotaria socialis]CAF3426025.1 unnamed protein product [Rotaria socialis]CAF3455324.1 unnamed protein product [Rotaria socialis]
MTHLNKGCQAYLLVRNYSLNLNVANIDDSSSTEDSSVSHTKKLFWVTRYSLGKTLSKELLIEHEFADDETRHRLIELHTPIDNERKYHFLLATVALLLNPPIGLIACIFVYMAKRRSEYMLKNYENIIYERAAARYAFISYILSIISIGLTVSIITGILLYFLVIDLKIANRIPLNSIRDQDMSSMKPIDITKSQQQEQDLAAYENEEIVQ